MLPIVVWYDASCVVGELDVATEAHDGCQDPSLQSFRPDPPEAIEVLGCHSEDNYEKDNAETHDSTEVVVDVSGDLLDAEDQKESDPS